MRSTAGCVAVTRSVLTDRPPCVTTTIPRGMISVPVVVIRQYRA